MLHTDAGPQSGEKFGQKIGCGIEVDLIGAERPLVV